MFNSLLICCLSVILWGCFVCDLSGSGGFYSLPLSV